MSDGSAGYAADGIDGKVLWRKPPPVSPLFSSREMAEEDDGEVRDGTVEDVEKTLLEPRRRLLLSLEDEGAAKCAAADDAEEAEEEADEVLWRRLPTEKNPVLPRGEDRGFPLVL